MSNTQFSTPETPEGKTLHERAIKCRRLADATGDLQFALKVNAIANEYEVQARAAEKRTSPGAFARPAATAKD
jgi:hypothetical protein